jgi:threonine synthase
MKFYSTNSPQTNVSLATAIMDSLPPDNGLYMPEYIPNLPDGFFKNIEGSSFAEIAYEIAVPFLSPDLSLTEIRTITDDAINFPVPLKKLRDNTFILELFHGPTLAFKDVGARFMARTMAFLNRNENSKLTILVATSGDTGSAVAHGFHNVEGIEVIILYPSGKVSPLQEKQLTTLGGNITALEINGTFDDCQRLVKQAFLDAELSKQYRLSSANSINIARLIPQSFYYVDAYRQLEDKETPFLFSVPSGNFGNLTAGILAKKMGLPVTGFIASTNLNHSVPRYLENGVYEPTKTIATISNAMDVGSPSNFVRMQYLYDDTVVLMRNDIKGNYFTDEQTRVEMQTTYNHHRYILDPHGAIGLLGWDQFKNQHTQQYQGIVLETAHPAKFLDVVNDTLGIEIDIPEALSSIANLPKKSILMEAEFESFKEYLLSR